MKVGRQRGNDGVKRVAALHPRKFNAPERGSANDADHGETGSGVKNYFY
jgi:hypothetical protein